MPASAQQAEPLNLAIEPLQPLPQKLSLNPEKIALGQDLFFDTRLSKDSTLSCASCHDLALGGTDGKPFSVGMDGAVGNINTPTVFNSGFSFVQFWDGRAENLNTQMGGPINNPAELGASWHGMASSPSSRPTRNMLSASKRSTNQTSMKSPFRTPSRPTSVR